MDNYVLYGRDGASPINLGTYLNAGEGQPDFDFGNVFRAEYTDAAAIDDAGLAFISSGRRAFRFPLLLRPAGQQTGASVIDQVAAIIRQHALGGGYIDLQPEGIPSAAAVRFDVLGGQLREAYNIRHQGVSRRMAQLELGVRPFGYWPTEILLASAAAATYGPQRLTWNTGSVVGDAPALARFNLVPTNIASPIASAVGLWGHYIDGFAWSIARASGATLTIMPSAFVAATSALSIPAASVPITFATTISEPTFTPYGQFMRIGISPTWGPRWLQLAGFFMPPDWATSYDGRFRVFGYFRSTPSWSATAAYQVTMDVAQGASQPGGFYQQAGFLASAAPVGTVLPQANASFGDIANNSLASGAFQIIDLGEHTIPYGPSGLEGRTAGLRLWVYPGPSNMGVATPALEFGGFWLQPLSGPAGAMERGMIYPTQWNVTASSGFSQSAAFSHGHKVQLDRIRGRAFMTPRDDGGDPAVASEGMLSNLMGNHQGALPVIPGSAGSLDVLPFGRQTARGATNGIFHGGHALRMSLYYRPQFVFMPGGF